MIGYNRGDVVLVSFLFTDQQQTKSRPAVILSTPAYHAGRQEVILAAITSNITKLRIGDHLIRSWQEAGLLRPSVATGILRTIKSEQITRKLGTMPAPDMKSIDQALAIALGLKGVQFEG